MSDQSASAVAARKRFIWTSAVEIEAETLEEAHALIEDIWGDDCSWVDYADHVRVFAPGGEPDDVYDLTGEVVCICPDDLVARGGFRGGCPFHS